MRVEINRMNGPCTDRVVKADFTLEEIEIVKDTLKLVNFVINDREQWYIKVDDERDRESEAKTVHLESSRSDPLVPSTRGIRHRTEDR